MLKKLSKLMVFVLFTAVFVIPFSFIVTAKPTIPNDAKEFKGHYYKSYTESVTWSEAKKRCEEMGGYLATITNGEEQKFIESINNKQRRWIGGYRDERFSWFWVTGEAWDYTNWGAGEPNDKGNEKYVAVWPEKWNDMNDNNKAEQSGFICEWNMAESDQNTSNTDTGTISNFTATKKGNMALLNWKKYKGADFYIIHSYDSKVKKWGIVAVIMGYNNSVTITELKKGVKYSFRVAAEKGIKNGSKTIATSKTIKVKIK